MWSVEAGEGANPRFYPSFSLQRHPSSHLHLGTEGGEGWDCGPGTSPAWASVCAAWGALSGTTVLRPLQPSFSLSGSLRMGREAQGATSYCCLLHLLCCHVLWYQGHLGGWQSPRLYPEKRAQASYLSDSLWGFYCPLPIVLQNKPQMVGRKANRHLFSRSFGG